MQISIRHHENTRFTATTEEGHIIPMDSSSEVGPATAATPMQLVAAAIGGCSAIDIVGILTKARQEIDSFEIDVEGKRAESAPRVFTALHIHFELKGEIDFTRAQRAVELSLGKYCSVSKMLENSVEVTGSFAVNGRRGEWNAEK